MDASVFTLPCDQVTKTAFVSITIIQHNVYRAQIIPKLLSQVGPGGDNEKLADLLAGVADHLCQVQV